MNTSFLAWRADFLTFLFGDGVGAHSTSSGAVKISSTSFLSSSSLSLSEAFLFLVSASPPSAASKDSRRKWMLNSSSPTDTLRRLSTGPVSRSESSGFGGDRSRWVVHNSSPTDLASSNGFKDGLRGAFGWLLGDTGDGPTRNPRVSSCSEGVDLENGKWFITLKLKRTGHTSYRSCGFTHRSGSGGHGRGPESRHVGWELREDFADICQNLSDSIPIFEAMANLSEFTKESYQDSIDVSAIIAHLKAVTIVVIEKMHQTYPRGRRSFSSLFAPQCSPPTPSLTPPQTTLT